MKARFSETVNHFLEENISLLGKFSKWFAKHITLSIMNKDYNQLEILCKDANDMRDEVEFESRIEKTKEFFYGYNFAYENVARKLLQEFKKNEEIDRIIINNSRLKEIIWYLGENEYAKQSEIAKYLKISASSLWNYLNKQEIKSLNLFTVDRIGKSAIYSLSLRSEEYYRLNSKQDDKKEGLYEEFYNGLEETLERYQELKDIGFLPNDNEIHRRIFKILSNHEKKNYLKIRRYEKSKEKFRKAPFDKNYYHLMNYETNKGQVV